jgi:hypothetical protein
MYLFIDRSRKGLAQTAVVAVSALLLTSPWWINVLQTHGLDPFIAATTAVTGDSKPFLARIFFLLQFIFTEEPFLPMVAFLGLVGAFRQLTHRRYFLPAWMALAYLFEPRGGTLYMMLPLVMLAAIGLRDVILPAFRVQHPDPTTNQGVQPAYTRGMAGFSIFLLVYLLVAGYASAYKIFDRVTLAKSEHEAMLWIRENTPSDARFLVLSGNQPLLDPASDWFPALTNRVSAATVFGYEWVNDGKFTQRISQYESLQDCLNQAEACLDAWKVNWKQQFTHVYIQSSSEFAPLGASLQDSPEYKSVYHNEEVEIFELIED